MMESLSAENPYYNERKVKTNLMIVCFVHLSVVLVPLFLSYLASTFTPKEYVMRVGLADAPPGDSMDLPKEQVAALRNNETSAETPSPKTDLPKPSKIDDLPPQPVIQEPVVTPPVQETVPDKPKTPEKKTPEKKTPDKQPSKILTAEDIRRQIANQQKDPAKVAAANAAKAKANAEAKARADAAVKAAKARADAIASMKNTLGASGSYGTTRPGQTGVLAPDAVQKYYDKLTDYIRPLWREPDASSLNGSRPSVTIRLEIDKSGRVLSAKIDKASGIKVMDDSIKALIATLKTVPVPPEALIVPVTLMVSQ